MNENGFQDKNLAELGEILRRTREEKGISLEDVVKDTKIPRRHLMAIESGSIDELPGKAFARCFIKEYLNYLKLERLWPQYDSLVALDEQVEISQVLGTYTPPPKGFKTTSRWWVYAVLIVLLVTSGGLLSVRREHIINVIKQQSQVTPSEEIAKETIK
ncbi:MAG: helix-turn-helix domain-containing protein, partial [Acetomicrobium sp.]